MQQQLQKAHKQGAAQAKKLNAAVALVANLRSKNPKLFRGFKAGGGGGGGGKG